jgi:hypothetical protein
MVGNLSNFTRIDVLRCFFRVEDKISRSALSEELKLGEGTVRTILDALKRKKLLLSDKKGHRLSEEGASILKKLKEHIEIKRLTQIKIFPDKKKIAVQIKKPGMREKAYILRDEAVKNGAEGALILEFDKRLRVYGSDFGEDFSAIENKLDLKKNDFVIVAYADSYRLAEHGALAAAAKIDSALESLMVELG